MKGEHSKMRAELKNIPIVATYPPHEPTDVAKLLRIAEQMRSAGWRGRPVLAMDCGGYYKCLTGSHRIAAARLAGLETIPALVLDCELEIIPDFGEMLLDELVNSEAPRCAVELLEEEILMDAQGIA